MFTGFIKNGYIEESIYPYQNGARKDYVKLWILQSAGFTPPQNVRFQWTESLPDAKWDDTKFWNE